MTPNGCGRFCAACQKTVIDFTVMTDAEILDIFRNSETIPCGRFFPEQLNRPLQETQIIKPFPFYRKIAAAVLALQAVTIASFAQAKKKPATAYHKKSIPATKKQMVKGRLLNSETEKPVAYFSLAVKAAGIDSFQITTDTAGCFHFTLPDSIHQVSLSANDAHSGFAVNETVALHQSPAVLAVYGYPKHLLPQTKATVQTIVHYETHTMGVPAQELNTESFRVRFAERLIHKKTFWYRITHPFPKKHR